MYFFTDMLINRPIMIHFMCNDNAVHAMKNQSPIMVFDNVGINLRTRLGRYDDFVASVKKSNPT